MRFNVPVKFNLTAKRAGGERKQTTRSFSLVDIEVADQSGVDFPIVLSWHQDFPDFRFSDVTASQAFGPAPVDKPRIIRKFGETFLRPVLCRNDDPGTYANLHGEPADYLSTDHVTGLLERFETGSVFGTPMPTGVNLNRLKKNCGDGFVGYQHVESHDLDKKTAQARKAVSDKLLIDGVFYERCPEPTIIVFRAEGTYSAFLGSVETPVIAAVTTGPASADRVAYGAEAFHIEDWQAALKKANRMNSGSPLARLFAEINASNMPEIDDSSIYAEDVLWARRANRASAVIASAFGSFRARELTDEVFGLYSRLHKILHTAEDDSRFDLMSDVLGEIAQECRGTEWDAQAVLAETGLEALEARPVSLFTPGQGPGLRR